MLSAMMLTVTILSGCSSGNEENTANSTKDKEKDGTYDIVVMPKLVGVPFEYSCAATPQIRQTGNRLSGLAETAYASLLAQCFV